ncbi:MAG TPA: bifunctional diguanylate cyclase/phosphodiesterase [Steroidobacter sp.]|uniref:bifunctional diguanylate cyclase/phosphodiesterase n=1 Tax=Steroidobacter sp. TaxID=1978227 RepID=UPI002EDAB7E7
MSDSRSDSPTLRLRRLDASALELAELMREGRITTLFQPIVDPRSRGIVAHEALTRGPSDSWLHAPQNLFEAARRADLKVELDFLCIQNAFKRFVAARVAGQLFINVSPDTIYEHPNFAERFVEFARSAGMPIDRVVIELTEESLLEDYDRLRSAMQRLREAGCAVAIDDLGAGSSGLRTWSELKPDYVKIDRYFVTGIDADATKLEFVRSMLDMGRAMGCRVIAEGVETERECRELVDLGLDRLQGHLFGRPSMAPMAALQQVESLDRSIVTYAVLCAEHIANYVQPVPPEMRVTEVADLFRDNPEHLSFPVVQDGRPLGVVRRERLFDLLAKPLHPEIFNKKPVTAVMESPTLMIDGQLRLEQVSRLVTQKSRPRLTEEFVITKDGRYHGLGQTIDVLRLITEQQLQSAKHSNPLTLLPGNAAVRATIDKLIEARKRFVVAYFDLDSFKPYNDVYGYAHGDQVILHLAALLKNHSSARLDFIGHVGGDDFLVVLRSADWRERVVNVLDRFSETVGNFYSPEHAAAKSITAIDRDGRQRKFPLLTLSVAALDSETMGATSADAVAHLLAHVKKYAKQQTGNSFVLRSDDRIVDLLAAARRPSSDMLPMEQLMTSA